MFKYLEKKMYLYIIQKTFVFLPSHYWNKDFIIYFIKFQVKSIKYLKILFNKNLTNKKIIRVYYIIKKKLRRKIIFIKIL